jgi:hypothetical protein
MQPVVIRRSWTAVGLAVVVSGLTALVIWAVSLGALAFYEPIPFEVRDPVAITFACVFWLGLLRHLSPTKPALVIDDRGLVDQASNYQVGLIPWSEIRGAKIVWRTRKGGVQKVLAIAVRDLTPFMARVGIIARTLMRLEQWLSGSVIDIPQWSLRTPVEEVLSALQQHRRLVRCRSLGAVPARAVSWPESTTPLGGQHRLCIHGEAAQKGGRMAQWLSERLLVVFIALVYRWWAGLLGGAVCLYLTSLAYEMAVKEWAAGGRWVRAAMVGVLPGFMSFCCMKWGLMNLCFGRPRWSKDGGPEDDDHSQDRAFPGTLP